MVAVFVVAGCSVGGPAAPPVSTSAPPVSTPAPTLAEAVRQWEAVAGDHFEESARALETVSAAAGRGDEAAVRAGCTVLHDTNTVGLQRHLPTPDPALTSALQRMIDDMNTATHACLRFVEGRDAGQTAIYQDYLARAVEHLGRAKAQLDADLSGG